MIDCAQHEVGVSMIVCVISTAGVPFTASLDHCREICREICVEAVSQRMTVIPENGLSGAMHTASTAVPLIAPASLATANKLRPTHLPAAKMYWMQAKIPTMFPTSNSLKEPVQVYEL